MSSPTLIASSFITITPVSIERKAPQYYVSRCFTPNLDRTIMPERDYLQRFNEKTPSKTIENAAKSFAKAYKAPYLPEGKEAVCICPENTKFYVIIINPKEDVLSYSKKTYNEIHAIAQARKIAQKNNNMVYVERNFFVTQFDCSVLNQPRIQNIKEALAASEIAAINRINEKKCSGGAGGCG